MGRKILMVGLGGTGCKAVARVRERIIQERKDAADQKHFSDIQFVGFDTDRTGQELYGTLPMVWTARSASVADLLVGRDEWREWFPAENNFLLARNGLRGAGQLRSLSRLLLEDTMKRENSIDDPLAALHAAFDHLQQQDSDRQAADVVVMIISSFAGGTGSGIFIQVALYLRKMLLERMYCNTALIRGLFALPDIYTGSLHNDQEIESVYANAYASLKELCAINRLFSGNDRLAKDIRMRYEGLFDSQKDQDRSGKLPITMVPFNSIFFVDNVSSDGEKLPSLPAYESMIAEIAYMQIYSPMAPNMFSQEDNLIRSTILSRGQRIFASAGCSKIEYPHDDIVEYCVRRMMADSLSTDWLFFDRQYRSQLDEARKRRRTDPSVQLPKRATSFVDSVEQFLTKSTSQFAYLRDDIMIVPEKDDRNPDPSPSKKQDLFMTSLKDYLRTQTDGKSAKNEAVKKAAAEADVSNFGKKKEDIVKKISGSEKKLQQYYETVNEQLPAIQGAMLYELLPESMALTDSSQTISLSRLLKTSDGHTVHPTSARYLLYSLKLLMDAEMKKAAGEAKAADDKIKKHFSKDWNDKKEGRQTPAQAVPTLRKRAYVDSYAEEREKCFKNITKYAENKLLAGVLGACAGRISELIRHYELFCDCLNDILEDQKRDADRLETAHSLNTGITTYVQASPQAKRLAYQRIAGIHMDSLSKLYESILTELYSSVLTTEEQEEKMSYADDSTMKALKERLQREMGERIRVLFNEGLADTFRQTILSDPSDAVNITVIRALEKECDDLMLVNRYQSREEPRRAILENARARSVPLLMYDKNVAGNNSKLFWGISEKAAAELHGDVSAYFGGNEAVVQSERYSEYEISCYQAVYELALMDVMKFRDSGQAQGIYYKNYESLRKKMEQAGGDRREDALTPHTDKRWLEDLPMISNERNAQESGNAARVFWLGLLYERIKVMTFNGVKKYGVVTIEENGRRHSEDLLYGDSPVDPFDYLSVFKALNQNVTRTNDMKTALEQVFDADRHVKEKTESTLLQSKNPLVIALIDQAGKKNTNPLTIYGRMIKDSLSDEPETAETLSNALFDLLSQLKTTDAARTNLRHLIYRYSRYGKYPNAWKDYEPEWLDEWKAPQDAAQQAETAEENPEE